MGWWKRNNEEGGPRLGHLLFEFYTRQGCHLCDDALIRLRHAQARHHFQIRIIDVDADPELQARHGNWVPVVVLEGRVRFKGAINRVLLDRLLLAETRRLPS
ncbi:MAG: glutaredoxin family protein [Gemmataceae bacterium]